MRRRGTNADFEQIERADSHDEIRNAIALFYAPGTEPPAIRLPMRLILYQRDDCRLCDLALDVLAHARAPDFHSVFIDADAELEARYGERVPVLREDESNQELGWPFDVQTVLSFLRL
jgi:hypothetical protein